ncbi:MAG: hypothetical protein IPG43_16750 [Proteobacteria bacterium]|nr:hypothetical protein [Pseudomonadota bacterium]
MKSFTRILAMLAATLYGVVTAPQLKADTVTIGTATGPSTHVPFGFEDFAGNSPYQQIYRGTRFGGAPVLITGLTVFVDTATAHLGAMNYSNQHVSLSTSATAVGAMSSSFAANRGSDFTEVFSGSYTQGFAGFPIDPCPIADCSATSLSFSFEPFLYDPSAGDLLMDVSGDGVFNGDHLYFQAGADRDVSSLKLGGLFGNDPIVSIGFGLVTQFEFSAVPLPSPIWMLGAAFGGVLYSRRRVR